MKHTSDSSPTLFSQSIYGRISTLSFSTSSRIDGPIGRRSSPSFLSSMATKLVYGVTMECVLLRSIMYCFLSVFRTYRQKINLMQMQIMKSLAIGWLDDLPFYVLFNSISVISG